MRNGNWQVPTLTVLRSFGLLNDPQFVQDTRLRYFTKEYRVWLEPKDDFRLKSWTANDFVLEREQLQFSKMLVGAMFRSGVPLLAGTDTGNPYCFPGFSLHDELALLVESGLTPLAALQAATLNAAVFMNATDRYGSIAKAKIADLVLLDADPLQDIRNTTKISEVFLSGREFDRASLDRLLKSAEEEANKEGKLALNETAKQPSMAPSSQSNDSPVSVLPGQTEGNFIIKDFHFNSGEVLPELRLHYITLGTVHRNPSGEIDNAVLLLHSTGGDATEFIEPNRQDDKNNFQPRVAFAWSTHGSVIRGGFAVTNDYFGQALAVDFDLNTTLGFSSNFTTPANTYATDDPTALAPLFTRGFAAACAHPVRLESDFRTSTTHQHCVLPLLHRTDGA